MTSVSGIGSAAGPLTSLLSSSGPLSVASALAKLRLQPGSTVEISDTAANIQKNLDALQGVAARVTGLTSSDGTTQLSVGIAQYRRDTGILAVWGAGSGQTVDVTGVAAVSASSFAADRASWVESFTVADSSANLGRRLDDLQTLAAAGSLRQIVHTGAAAPLAITAAQLAADGDALALIKNGAYTLSIREASVSDTLGLDGQDALVANAKVKAVHVKDTTAAIEANLDALQRAGLRVRSLSQTDAATPLTLTARQLADDAIVVGKILTPYHLDVIRASASQVAKLAANRKVETISVADTAANLAKRWSLLNRLVDSLAAVEVSDSSNPVALTADQLALGGSVLAKFTVDADHDYRLAIRGVKAGLAASVASTEHVSSVAVADSADNLAANLADLKAVDAAGLLQSVAVTGRTLDVSLDAAQLLGDEAAATLGVFDKVTSRNVGIAVTAAAVADLDELAARSRVVSIGVQASSDEIESAIDGLAALGRRLARIEQTDSGSAIDLTQAAFDSRASVLAKVAGGYRVALTGASAAKAVLDAMNSHVVSVSVDDTARNLAVNWRALRSIGSTLAAVTQTDGAALSLSAANYLLGSSDGLLAKFTAAARVAVTSATVAQALSFATDDAVDRVDVVDTGSAVTAAIDDLGALAGSGKLHGIVLEPTTTRLALHAGQLDGAQSVLDLVKDGRYTLALDQVAADQVATLLDTNHKIASMRVSADAAGVVDNLAELAAAGHKLLAIDRSDAADVALELSGDQFEAHRTTLAKIGAGYDAVLSDVSAAKAATLALAPQVRSLQVADTGSNLGAAWNALIGLESKLTGVAQSDGTNLAVNVAQWSAGSALAAKFSTTLGLAVSGAVVDDLAALDADDAVQQIALVDTAASITDAWSDLAGDAKIQSLQLSDPETALELGAGTYAASAALVARFTGDWTVALTDVALADAATLDGDAHVATLDVTGSSTDVATAFDTLAGLAKLASLALSDDGGTIALTAAQVLGGADTLAKLSTGYQLSASAATVADLAELADVDNLASVGISDSAASVGDGLDALVALGSRLDRITLTDATPVLTLTHAEWSAASAVLAKIDGSWQAELSQAAPSAVATLAADGHVLELAASGTAAEIALDWSALVAAWDGGSGKLSAITLTDGLALSLTEAQQTEGAAMIAALLADETIVTAP